MRDRLASFCKGVEAQELIADSVEVHLAERACLDRAVLEVVQSRSKGRFARTGTEPESDILRSRHMRVGLAARHRPSEAGRAPAVDQGEHEIRPEHRVAPMADAATNVGVTHPHHLDRRSSR